MGLNWIISRIKAVLLLLDGLSTNYSGFITPVIMKSLSFKSYFITLNATLFHALTLPVVLEVNLQKA